MGSWEKHQEIVVGKIRDHVNNSESVVTIHLMHNGHPYKEFACQVEFPHLCKNEDIALARIDKSHGYLHLDKLCKENPEKERIFEDMDVWDAATQLEEEWESYFIKWSNRDDTETSQFLKTMTL